MERLSHSIELLYLLAHKELKVRYKSSVLGYVWALANPFAFAFVYWLAFKFIMRVKIPNYSLFLIVGLFPWVWLNSGMTQATKSFQSNASLVKKVRLQRGVLPLSNLVHEMVHFLFALPVILAFLWFAGDNPLYASWLWQIPLMLLAQLAFAYPFALMFAIANVFVHDIEYLVSIAFSLLFFLTPIVYSSAMVPLRFRAYFGLNPVNSLIESWREVFFHGAVDWAGVGYVLLFAAVGGVLARWMYLRLAHRIGELL